MWLSKAIKKDAQIRLALRELERLAKKYQDATKLPGKSKFFSTEIRWFRPSVWWYILFVLGFVAVLYSALSGLYGVVYTDLIQFILAMTGSIGLAITVYIRAVKDDILVSGFSEAGAFNEISLNFFPSFDSSFFAVFTFFVYIFLTWWRRVPGNGYYVQRLLATRSEKDSVLAFLWFNICQYVIRP